MHVLASRRSLAWRVFLSNAAVLVGVAVFYVLTPATISSPVATRELIVLVAAMTVTLFVNLLLLDRAFAPLDALRRLMQRVDPLDPGRRIELGPADADVTALADAFNGMLDRLETERRESARRSLGAQEKERERIARELHDELGQVLTGLLLLLDEASRAPEAHSRRVVEEAREVARAGIEDVRRIVRDLRPEALDDLGLPTAMRVLARTFERHSGVAIEPRVPTDLPTLSSDQELVIYRVAQEALTNVARHAEAEHAELEVRAAGGQVEVLVGDDGRGFGGPPPDDGGIRGMRERALLVRGALSIDSSPGRGTRVRLSVPVEKS